MDYEHQLTFKDKPYYLTSVGEPVKLWITEKETTFTDVAGKSVKTPAGTLWGTFNITDPVLVHKIANKELTAFSVSVMEHSEADLVLTEFNKFNTKSANKSVEDIQHDIIKDIHDNISNKALIRDFNDPVLCSVTLTSLPCVNQAMFCNKSLSNNLEDDNMEKEENKTAEDTFLDSVQQSVKSFKNSLKRNENMKKEDIDSIIDEKLELAGKNYNEALQKDLDEFKATFKNEFENLRKEIENEIKIEEEATSKKNKDEETETETQTETGTETETNNDPANKKDETIKGRGDKGMNKEQANKSTTENKYNHSEQLESNYDGIGANKAYNENVISERDYLYRLIKGNKQANKSLDNLKISYKGLGIIPEAVQSAPAFSLISPALKGDFDATYTEANTQKLILDTQTFALYVRELLSIDPLMTDAQFRIDYEVSDEERVMYALRLDEDPTQDGISPEHYYFDNPDITATEIEVAKQKLDPMPVRAKLKISDRQLRQNVFGESLLQNSMDLINYEYNKGVSRINYFGDTEYDSEVDIKFRRRDGLFKQAGTTLLSDGAKGVGETGDFSTDDGVKNIFKQMFRALPFEAQQSDLYNLYVPPFIYDAYREYYLSSDKINFLGNITGQIELDYNKIKVKEAPILADPKGIELMDDTVSMLLTSPKNTHFSVGRALRVEPERIASTSSTNYWYTGDYDCKYALPEYAVASRISIDEYEEF